MANMRVVDDAQQTKHLGLIQGDQAPIETIIFYLMMMMMMMMRGFYYVQLSAKILVYYLVSFHILLLNVNFHQYSRVSNFKKNDTIYIRGILYKRAIWF